MDPDLPLIEITEEDDSLIHHFPDLNSKSSLNYSTFSPFAFPPSPAKNLKDSARMEKPSGSSSEDTNNKENINLNSGDMPKLGMEPMQMKRRKKGVGYNLRKSLAWDRAFLTDEGILDPLELSLISGIDTNTCGGGFHTISEEGNTSISQDVRCTNESNDMEASNEAPLKKLDDINRTTKGKREKAGCSIKNDDSLLHHKVTHKVLSSNRTNRSGSKIGGCSEHLTASFLKRPAITNTLNAAKRESKLPKLPASKGSMAASHMRHNLIPKPTMNAERSFGLKSSLQNAHGSQSKANPGSGNLHLPVKELAQKTVRNLTHSSKAASSTRPRLVQVDRANSRPAMVPDTSQLCNTQEESALSAANHLAQHAAANSNNSLPEAARLSSSGSRHIERASKGPLISDRLNPCENQERSAALARPSGLRMPSPSLRLFDPITASGSSSLQQKQIQQYRISDRNNGDPWRRAKPPMKSNDITENVHCVVPVSSKKCCASSTQLSPSTNYTSNSSTKVDNLAQTSWEQVDTEKTDDAPPKVNPESLLDAGRQDGIRKGEGDVGTKKSAAPSIENSSVVVQHGQANDGSKVVDDKSLPVEQYEVTELEDINTSCVPFQTLNIEQRNDDADNVDVFPFTTTTTSPRVRDPSTEEGNGIHINPGTSIRSKAQVHDSPVRDTVTQLLNDNISAEGFHIEASTSIKNKSQLQNNGSPKCMEVSTLCISALLNSQLSVSCTMPAESSSLEEVSDINDHLSQEESASGAIFMEGPRQKQDVDLIPREVAFLIDDQNQSSSLSHLRPQSASLADDSLVNREPIENHKSQETGMIFVAEKSQDSCGSISEAEPAVQGNTGGSETCSQFQSENQMLEESRFISNITKAVVEDGHVQLLDNDVLFQSCSRLTEVRGHSIETADHSDLLEKQAGFSKTGVKLEQVYQSNEYYQQESVCKAVWNVVEGSDVYEFDPRPSNTIIVDFATPVVEKVGYSDKTLCASIAEHNENYNDGQSAEYGDLTVTPDLELEQPVEDKMFVKNSSCMEYCSAGEESCSVVAGSMLEEKTTLFLDDQVLTKESSLSTEKILDSAQSLFMVHVNGDEQPEEFVGIMPSIETCDFFTNGQSDLSFSVIQQPTAGVKTTSTPELCCMVGGGDESLLTKATYMIGAEESKISIGKQVDVSLMMGEFDQEGIDMDLIQREVLPLIDDENQSSSLSQLRPQVEIISEAASLGDDPLVNRESVLQGEQCTITYPRCLEKERLDIAPPTVGVQLNIPNENRKSQEMGMISEVEPAVQGSTGESETCSQFHSENHTLEGSRPISNISKTNVEDGLDDDVLVNNHSIENSNAKDNLPQDVVVIMPSTEACDYFKNVQSDSSFSVSQQRTAGVTPELCCMVGGGDESLLTKPTYMIGAEGSKGEQVDEFEHDLEDLKGHKDAATLTKRSNNIKRQDNSLVIHPPNAVPFSDEWLAAFEAAGEEILTMKCGAVQHSPQDKALPEPSPWSPVKKKANQIGPYDCTKYMNALPSSSQLSD